MVKVFLKGRSRWAQTEAAASRFGSGAQRAAKMARMTQPLQGARSPRLTGQPQDVAQIHTGNTSALVVTLVGADTQTLSKRRRQMSEPKVSFKVNPKEVNDLVLRLKNGERLSLATELAYAVHNAANEANIRFSFEAISTGVFKLELLQEPIPMLLTCPECGKRHVDAGEFATKPHHTHVCQHCGMTWRPAIVPTVGVQFLPGFKDEINPAKVWSEADETKKFFDGVVPAVKGSALKLSLRERVANMKEVALQVRSRHDYQKLQDAGVDELIALAIEYGEKL